MTISDEVLNNLLKQGIKPRKTFGRQKETQKHFESSDKNTKNRSNKVFTDTSRKTSNVLPDSHSVDIISTISNLKLNNDQKQLIVRAMISAAKADGYFDEFERASIFDRIEVLDSEDIQFFKKELDAPIDIQNLAEISKNQGINREIFIASLLAIEVDSPEEERYLIDLAECLELSSETIDELKNLALTNKQNIDREGSRSKGINQWYFTINGQRQGPMHLQLASRFARLNPEAKCWREGFEDWFPVSDVDELKLADQTVLKYTGKTFYDDEIDFQIFGTDIQFVEIELDPEETAIAEAGSLMYKNAGIKLDTIFGDGRKQNNNIIAKLVSAGERVLSGESLFLTSFTNISMQKSQVAFSAPYPGTIIPLKLSHFGNKIICQKDCFLAAAKGVRIGIYFQRKIFSGIFGGEGFVMQSLEGDGWAFVHAGGSVIERTLEMGEIVDVETGSVVGFTDTISFDVRTTGDLKTIIFGGEGLFLTRLTGPGKIWLQSMPILKLASRLNAFMPKPAN